MRDGFDLDTGFGEELDGLFHRGVVFGFELQLNFADRGSDLGAADVEHHVHRLGHLVNDRFFDEIRRKSEPDLPFYHAPPAMAGIIEISAPSATAVLEPSLKRMSSPFTNTLMKRRIWPFSSQMRSFMPG